jgi:hypothetical protein
VTSGRRHDLFRGGLSCGDRKDEGGGADRMGESRMVNHSGFVPCTPGWVLISLTGEILSGHVGHRAGINLVPVDQARSHRFHPALGQNSI